MTDTDRETLARTFDRAAAIYHDARPDYPEALVDDLVQTTGVTSTSHLLEVGCGTGKATLPLARRGLRITALEPGPRLAAVARRTLRAFPRVDVVEGRLEDWTGPGETFDLVFAATAWHWVDPATRYALAARLLTRSGHLAFWDATHVFPPGGDPFFAEIQDVYERIGADRADDAMRPAPGELLDRRDEIEASGLFEVVEIRHVDWEVVYDAEAYITLLRTFSNHIVMADQDREHLFDEIRHRLAQRADGRVRRGWGAVLHVARRRG